MRSFPFLTASLFALPMVAGCVAVNHATTPSLARSRVARELNPQVDAASWNKFAKDNNSFAFDMYHKIRAEEGAKDNMVFSPVSINIALSMVYAGALDTTADDIAKAMHYQGWKPKDLFRAFNLLDQVLESRGDQAYHTQKDRPEAQSASSFRLNIINSIWCQQDIKFETPFLDTLALNYGAGVTLADFFTNSDAERERINSWVAKETRDKIQNLIPEGVISSDTVSVLVNAIHLKMPWSHSFKLAGDRMSFRIDDTQSASVAYFTADESFEYGTDGDVQVVSVPLEGTFVHLVALVPPLGQLASLEEKLSANYYAERLASLRSERLVQLRVPVVNFTSPSLRLRSKLKSLGMVAPFDSQLANFKGISTEVALHLEDVIHKAMLAMNQDGVEAAAATAAILNKEMATVAPDDVIELNLDRPFVVTLVDRPTGVILFAGHILDPR